MSAEVLREMNALLAEQVDAFAAVLEQRDLARDVAVQLEQTLARVAALHAPENRYSDSGREWSRDTAEEAAERADIDVSAVECWRVCGHCGRLESWRDDEAGLDWDYRESLWPCATARALGATGEQVTP